MKIKIYIYSVTVPAPISVHELPESRMRTSDNVYTASVSDLEMCRSLQALTWALLSTAVYKAVPGIPLPVRHVRSLISFKHFNNILSQKIKPKVSATAGEAYVIQALATSLSSLLPPSPHHSLHSALPTRCSSSDAPLPSACVVFHFLGPLLRRHLLREAFHNLFPTHSV